MKVYFEFRNGVFVKVVYLSLTGKTRQFVKKLNWDFIEISKKNSTVQMEEPYIVITPTYGDTEVDFDSYSAKVAGQEVAVNAKELEILDYLVKNEGRALTRSQIIDAVWKMTDEVPFDRVIDVYIKELRKKLDLDCILTVRNVGYKLERNQKTSRLLRATIRNSLKFFHIFIRKIFLSITSVTTTF